VNVVIREEVRNNGVKMYFYHASQITSRPPRYLNRKVDARTNNMIMIHVNLI
jgi:hypothetical protein